MADEHAGAKLRQLGQVETRVLAGFFHHVGQEAVANIKTLVSAAGGALGHQPAQSRVSLAPLTLTLVVVQGPVEPVGGHLDNGIAPFLEELPEGLEAIGSGQQAGHAHHSQRLV